jgi:hypothetical protein
MYHASDWIGSRARWSGDDLPRFPLDEGLHFGIPEAASGRERLRIPPRTGAILVALLGPSKETTDEWEPSGRARQVQGAMWARFLKRLYDGRECELVFTPSYIAPWGKRDPLLAEHRMRRQADLERRHGCRRVADFCAIDLGVDDPQMLPWSYAYCPKPALEGALREAGGPGATGFVTWRRYRNTVGAWSALRPRTLRLDAALDYSLFLFQVLWHGEALAILTRYLDPKLLDKARGAPEVAEIVERLKPAAQA